jgi:hypothetical protein
MPPMTLISALRSREGFVLTSDSRETRGPSQARLARNVKKIYVPREGFLLAWAGFETVAQAFTLAMERADGLSTSLDRVEIKRRLEALIAEIRANGGTDMGEWIVAWWSKPDDRPVAVRLFSGRTGKWIDTWEFGDDARPQEIAHVVAEAIRFVPRTSLTLEQAKLLALKVMRDTIHIGVESIGGEVQLAAVTRDGIEFATGAVLRSLNDTLGAWEEQAAALLPGAVPVPAQTTTPDRGVRLPGDPAQRAPVTGAQRRRT